MPSDSVSIERTHESNGVVRCMAGAALGQPVRLAQIKADHAFMDLGLVRMGRLSVVPATEEQFKKLVKEYPESRYATDALAKLEVCRGRLAQKEVWVAAYYLNQGNPGGARQRLEKVIKDYPRAPVIPEALSLLADVNFSEGRDKDAVDLLRQVANDYSYTEWGKRAAQRLRAQR
jgi:outer membrane protein assembly factor BamD (BamD/ComL family)